MMFCKKYSLYIAWLLSLIGVIFSLYFSETKHLEACHLCWYQRIALFPLAIILAIASYRSYYGIAFYLLPQVALGWIIALYQVAIQEIPGFHPIDLCGNGPDCVTKHFVGIGFLTIPMLSAIAFLLIGIFLSIAFSYAKEGEY